jgi:hypothetical protein
MERQNPFDTLTTDNTATAYKVAAVRGQHIEKGDAAVGFACLRLDNI